MKSGKELLIIAVEKEYNRLCKRAEKFKAEADEFVSIGNEAIAIHKEFNEIVNSNEQPEVTLKKLENLEKRRGYVNKVLKKDSQQVFNQQFEAETERDALNFELQRLKFIHQ